MASDREFIIELIAEAIKSGVHPVIGIGGG